PTSAISPLSLHDALPIWLSLFPGGLVRPMLGDRDRAHPGRTSAAQGECLRLLIEFVSLDLESLGRYQRPGRFLALLLRRRSVREDRKSTRLNSSHVKISY